MSKIRQPQTGRVAAALMAAPDEVDPNLQNDNITQVDEPLNSDADDPVAVMTAQMEQLRQANQALIEKNQAVERGLQEATAKVRTTEGDIHKLRNETTQSQYDAITSALAAANSEAEGAQRDIEIAMSQGDVSAQAKAYRTLARAESNISRLEDGKTELEARISQQDEVRRNPPPQQQSPVDPLENSGLPDRAKSWLRAHPDYLSDQRKNAKIQSLHWDVLDEGHDPFSRDYFESLEQHLGLQKVNDTAPSSRSASMVTAPVTREAPSATSGSGRTSKVTLTPQQKEAAKIAGISEVEYAKQFQVLLSAKADGNYGGQA